MSGWDHDKLNVLMAEIESSVRAGIAEEENAGTPDDQSSAMVVGYWMYRLKECKA